MALSVEYAGAANSILNSDVVSSASFTITNANKLVVIMGLGESSAQSCLSITWNGGSSFASNVIAGADIFDSWCHVKFYYFDNPSAGTGVVAYTNSPGSAAQLAISVITFIDAASGTPAAGETSGTSNSPSVTVAGSANGNIVVSALMSDIGDEGTITASGTNFADVEDMFADTDFNAQYQTATGADTVCSWTQTQTALYAAAGIAIAASGATQSNAPRVTRHLQNMMRG